MKKLEKQSNPKSSREKIVVQMKNESNSEQADSINDFKITISKSITFNLTNLKNMLDTPDDLKIRKLKLGKAEIDCAIVFIEGIVDGTSIQQNILNNLESVDEANYPGEPTKLMDFIYWKLLSVSEIEHVNTLDELSFALLSGCSIIYIDGLDKVLTINTSGGQDRSLTEPVTETLIRGPRRGFIENIRINLGMVRKGIKDPNLRIKTYQSGRRTKKNIAVVYIDGIIHPDIVKEVDRRLKSIDIDNAPESGYIEEMIEDNFLSPFPQMLNTERPDKAITAILQGKLAIFLDGTPFALLAPMNFSDVLQSPEDYYERWTIGSLLRLLRYLGAFISIFLPSLYIALITHHPGMIPSKLVFSIAATREGVPFTAIVEALLMVITMELLQEAGARLPQTIGQTIGIVGGLVIGDAAVQAGFVSPIMVIVIAITAIANFTIPAYSVAIGFRIIRFGFMFAAALYGLFGVVLVYIMINIHFVNLKSFGVPYSAPFAPFFLSDWNDTIFRLPITTMKTRPVLLDTEDEIMSDNTKKER